MIFLYRLFYPLFIISTLPLILFSTKIRRGILGRMGVVRELCTVSEGWSKERPRFWFHFSSAGEFEQTLPFLNSLRHQCPQAIIVLTYFSPSAERAVELEEARCSQKNGLPPWDFATFSPFDFFWSVRRFLLTMAPTGFITINKELWPELLTQLSQRNIPRFLFAGSFGNISHPERFWYQWLLPFFSNVTTINSESTDFCEQLTQNRPVIEGEPRVERILQRVHSSVGALPWLPFFEGQTTLIGASLWEEDFKVLVECLPQVLSEFRDLRLLLVPHEPTSKRIHKWRTLLKAQGIPIRLWSHWLTSPDETSHLLVDQVGILAELYTAGSTVLVGGSFRKKVHNVLEPFFSGCLLVTGPFIQNSAEAIELERLSLLRMSHDKNTLLMNLRSLLTERPDRSLLKQQALSVFQKHQQISETSVQLLINKCLDEKQPISSTPEET